MKFVVIMSLLFSIIGIFCVYDIFTMQTTQNPLVLVRRRATDISWWLYVRPSFTTHDCLSIYDKELWTKLHDAAYINDSEAIELEIKENKIPVDIRDYYGQTPLWWSSYINSYDAAYSLIINFNANLNIPDKRGTTPLHVAKSIEMVELLLKYGAAIKLTDEVGNTLLHVLAREDGIEDAKRQAILIKHLITKKYITKDEINAKNIFGNSPYEIARDKILGYSYGYTKEAFEQIDLVIL